MGLYYPYYYGSASNEALAEPMPDLQGDMRPSPSTQTVVHNPFASSAASGKSPKASILKNSRSKTAPTNPPQPPSNFKLRSSYHYERHPLSHSSNTILMDSASSTKDPVPILPNRSPGTPDVWVPRPVRA